MKSMLSMLVACLLGTAAVNALPMVDLPETNNVAAWQGKSHPVIPHEMFDHIIGGVEVSPPGKYQFLVALLASSSGSAYDQQFCGASLVGNKYVVTAAHCCEGMGRSTTALVGGHDLKSSTSGTKIGVSKITIHPSYNRFSMDNDICMLELASSTSLTPIGIDSDGSSSKVGTTATVAGWGNTKSVGSSFPNKAQEVNVPVVSNDVCNQPSSYGGDITEGMLCAGFQQGGKDSCQGDSGGPLFVGNTLIGVVSWGEGCAMPNKYGVYARVSEYSSWIRTSSGEEN